MTRRILAIAAIASLPLMAACSASHHQAAPKPHHSAPATTAADSHASADCDKLAHAAFPPAAYDQLVTREVSRLAGGGTASHAQERQARRTIASEIRQACPQFSDLIR